MVKEDNVMNGYMGGGAFPLVPNLPQHQCQSCSQPLCIAGVGSYSDNLLADSYFRSGCSTHGENSVLGFSRMDHSYVVLPNRRSQQQQIGFPPQSRRGQYGKAMEGSFVVVQYSEPASDNAGLHSTITVHERAFEIVKTQAQVEQLLCVECMTVLTVKLEEEVEDVNRDIEAYEACLQRLEGEAQDIPSEPDFLKEKLKMEEEERQLEAEIAETEKTNAEVNAELKELELKSASFKDLEERYWQEFNNFQFQLISYQEVRDEVLAKVEVSLAHLELLKETSALSDVLPILQDGEFGTINNFRLG